MKKNKIFRIFIYLLISIILGVSVYSWNAEKLIGEQMPMPFGFGCAVVLSGSMEPTLSVNDLIIVKKADDYNIDDIVVFQDIYDLVVHRIVAVDDETVQTQGDANNVADEPINISAVKGKVLFWIPLAGNVVDFLKSPVGTICIIAAAIALIEIPYRNEKRKDDEERKKIIEEIERLKQEKQS